MLAGGIVRWIRRPLSPWARLRTVLSIAFVWGLLYQGAKALEQMNLKIFGGHEKLWLFQKMEQHRYTAMAMLTGTLRLRAGLEKIGHDEQIYNGAGFTNWGFGVPLLQLPFHALAPKFPSVAKEFFPDRAIFLFYVAGMTVALWAAIDRLLAMREAPDALKLRRHLLSWTATGFVLMVALYPLMSSRFYIYEETVCYLIVFELFALCAYVFALRSWSSMAVWAMGVAAGLGLLIRPTGLIYFGVWSLLLLLERRRWRALLAYAAGAVPLVGFWMYSNWVRSGSVVSAGISNSLPWFDYHTPMLRFGAVCANTLHHALEAAARLFSSFFITISDDPTPWMKKCHFDFEDRPPPPGGCWSHEPFFGAAVFVVLAWMCLHMLGRREKRLAFYVPSATLVAMFGAYALALGGFAWRYAGDFWPLIVLAAVQYYRFLPTTVTRLFGTRLAFLLFGAGFATYTRYVEPSIPTIETLDVFSQAGMWADFTNSRWAQDKPFSNHLTCTNHPDQPYHNGQGWRAGCDVDTFTNVYIGVPAKLDDHYELRFKTKGFEVPLLRVYVNGRIYQARRSGDGYVADVSIHFDRLASPTVIATIEWTRELDPMPGKLLSIELS